MIKKVLIAILTGVLYGHSHFTIAQNTSEEVYDIVDIHPMYPGGMAEFYQFVYKNLVYPEDVKSQGIQGQVMIQFVVNKEGEVIHEEVAKGLHEKLDAEALRVIKLSQNWRPGRMSKDGKAYSVRMLVPVTFRLPTQKELDRIAKRKAKEEKKASRSKSQ